MKRFLLPVFVLVALVLVVILLRLQSSGSRDADSHGPADPSANGRPNAELDRSRDELTAPDATASEVARASAASGSAIPSDGGRVLEGEVRAPLDCVVDTQVEVFALARPVDLDTLLNEIQPRRPDDTSAPLAGSLVLARAKLDGAGHFRLQLPSAAHKAHLICAGRSWYVGESVTFDLTEARSFAALQAECGGWIAGRVDLPADAGSTAQVDGEIVQLAPSITSFAGGPGRMTAAFRRMERRAVVKDGAFEIGALDPEQAFQLDFESRAFAETTLDVAEVARGRATPVDLRLERGGFVSGRVTVAGTGGVAGATVEASVARGPFGFAERVVRRATTAADGSFELTAVTPGTVQVSARAPELPASEPRAVEVADRARATGVDIELGGGASISGTVRWPDGTPGVGAEVRASTPRGQGFGPGAFRALQRRGDEPRAIADATGHFVLQGLTDGEHTLTAEALKPADAQQLDPKDAAARRDASWRARASGVATGTTDATLTLGPPLAVHGVVTRAADGAPVPAFRVQSNAVDGGGRRGGGGGPMAMAFSGFQRQQQDVSNERGEFTFTFPREGQYQLVITADGFVASDPIDVEVPVKDGAAPLAITLARGALVRGVVRSPLGTPVANATVAPVDATPAMFGPRGGPGGAGDAIRARTDAEGRFTLGELSAGRLVLSAESSSYARSDELTLDLAEGATIPDAVLVLRDGGTITGESYEDGRPTAGRTVTAMDMRTFAAHSGRTDAAGRFRIEHVPAGTWRVTAMPSASDLESATAPAAGSGQARGGGMGAMGGLFSRMKSTNADVVDGAETHVVLGAPPEAPVAVHGKVTQGGTGVAGVRLAFLGQGDSFGPGMKTTQTGADGTYAIQLDKPGDYSISVQSGGRGMSSLEFVETVKALPDVVLDLVLPDARLSGRVRTPEGEPAEGVRVSVFPAAMGEGGSILGGGFSEVTTDANGEFDVKSLRAGTYSLIVGGSGVGGFRGFGASQDPRWARKILDDVQLAESEWRKDVDVRLEPPIAVEVEVVDDKGGPILGATVFARDESGRVVDRMSSARTDANGKARYTGLAEGAYTFSARKEPLASGETPRVTVRSSGTPGVKVTLSNGTLLVVTTVDANDAPVRARVRVTDEAGRDVAGLMSTQDLMERATRGMGGNEQKIGPLPPGTYKVAATATDGRTLEKTVTLTGTAERRMTLAFGN